MSALGLRVYINQQLLAVVDHLFWANAVFMCCQDSSGYVMSDIRDIHELYARVQLLGCNHGERMLAPVEHDEVARLEQRCASLLVWWICDMPNACLKTLEENGGPALLTPSLQKQINLLKRPARLAITEEGTARATDASLTAAARDIQNRAFNELIKEVDKDSSASRRKKLAELQKRVQSNLPAHSVGLNAEEALDVNQGEYWIATSRSLVENFCRFCSRVFREYHLQKEVFDKYPVRKAGLQPSYSKATADRLAVWFKSACCVEADDGFQTLYRNLVFRHSLPLGASLEKLRQSSTRFETMNPENLLHSELGSDCCGAISELLMLAQYAYIWGQKNSTRDMKSDWLDDYYILPCDLSQKRYHLDDTKSFGLQRRPIAVFILHAWWIHDQGEWIPANNATDLIAKDIALRLAPPYDGKLASNNYNIAGMVDMMTKEDKKPKIYVSSN
jgi:hypothetical protein